MAYTPEQYADAGKWIFENLSNPELIARTASGLGLSANDLLIAAQTVAPNLTLQDVSGYFQQANTAYQPPVIDYNQPVYDPGPVYDSGPVYDPEPAYHAGPVYDPGPVFTSTADVSLTPSGGGALGNVAGNSVDEYGRTAQDKQIENLYRQLDAIDAWNTAGATREGAEAPWLMDQASRMMAVGVQDDFTGAGPGILLYDPAKERGEIVSSGSLSSMFTRGDPAAAYEQAKNSLPYFQQKALLGITGPTTQEQERQIIDALERNSLPALTFMEYGLGQFAPPDYGLDPNVARRREENEQREIKEKPLEYFKEDLNLSPYQGGLPTIYQFPEQGGMPESDYTDPRLLSSYISGALASGNPEDARRSIATLKTDYGVTDEQLANASGYSLDQVKSFLNPVVTSAPTASSTVVGGLGATAGSTDTMASTGTKGTDSVTGGLGAVSDEKPVSLTDQIRTFIDPNSTGGAWTTKSGASSGQGFGVEGMLNELGQRIEQKTGVTDLNNLQLKYIDAPITENIYGFSTEEGGTRYARLIPDPATGEGTWQILTPEEISRLRTERDYEGNTINFLDGTVKQGQVVDKTTGKLISDREYVDLGGWGQGPGITNASINFDANGKPIVSTYGEDTTDPFVQAAAKLGPVVTIANILSGGALTPVQLAVNAVNAADAAYRGNFLPALTVAVSGGAQLGVIDPTLANQITSTIGTVNAIKNGDVGGLLMSGSGLAGSTGLIDPSTAALLNDTGTMIKIAKAVDQGDVLGATALLAGAANKAGLLTKNVVDEYNVTGGPGTQIPGGLSAASGNDTLTV
jgi:hypothetical protein